MIFKSTEIIYISLEQFSNLIKVIQHIFTELVLPKLLRLKDKQDII